jgi:hypothetical protein
LDNTNRYFERVVVFEGTSWRADDVTVGNSGDTGPFRIEAWAVSQTEADRLGRTGPGEVVTVDGAILDTEPVTRVVARNTCGDQ